MVEVDLQTPGWITKKGDAHFDRLGLKAEPLALRSGASLLPRRKTPYALDMTCGIGYLGQVNDIHWVTEEQAIPDVWAEAIEADGEIVVAVRLRGEPGPHVTATANGYSVRYEPRRDRPADCDG